MQAARRNAWGVSSALKEREGADERTRTHVEEDDGGDEVQPVSREEGDDDIAAFGGGSAPTRASFGGHTRKLTGRWRWQRYRTS